MVIINIFFPPSYLLPLSLYLCLSIYLLIYPIYHPSTCGDVISYILAFTGLKLKYLQRSTRPRNLLTHSILSLHHENQATNLFKLTYIKKPELYCHSLNIQKKGQTHKMSKEEREG